MTTAEIYRRHDTDVIEVFDIDRYNVHAGYRSDETGRMVLPDVATCGTCGRSWDDGVSTGSTPAPSGRCPFEYEHEDEQQERAEQPREWSVTCYLDVSVANLEEASDIAARIVSALGTDERYPELVNAEWSDIYENEVI